MKRYVVYEPKTGVSRDRDGAERLVFVRESFSWLAFLLPLPWLIWRRAWFGLLVYAVGLVLVGATAVAGISEGAELVLAFLVNLAIGLEAPWFRQKSLLRRGWRPLAVTTGNTLEEAERAFFADWLAETPTLAAAEAPPAAPASRLPPRFLPPDPSVLGLFPRPEGGR